MIRVFYYFYGAQEWEAMSSQDDESGKSLTAWIRKPNEIMDVAVNNIFYKNVREYVPIWST